jgi:hypothetical protein
MRRVLAAATCALCMGVGRDLSAQTSPVVLYLAYIDESGCNAGMYPACKVSRLMRATLDGPRSKIDWQRPVPTVIDVKEGYVTPDGGTVIWLGISLATGPSLYVYDVVTGHTETVGSFHGAKMLLGNPVRPEVYVFDDTGVVVLTASGRRAIDLPCTPANVVQPPDISRDGQRVSVACFSNLNEQTVVFDPQSGIIGVVSKPGVITADGTGLFTRDAADGQLRVQRRTLSDQVLTDASNPGIFFMSDRATGDVISWTRGTYPNVWVLDGATLATKWATNLSINSGGNQPKPVFDPPSGLVAASSNEVVVQVP